MDSVIDEPDALTFVVEYLAGKRSIIGLPIFAWLNNGIIKLTIGVNYCVIKKTILTQKLSEMK